MRAKATRATSGPPTFARLLESALFAAGGLGEVYRARDPRLDRQVAIKLYRPWMGG